MDENCHSGDNGNHMEMKSGVGSHDTALDGVYL